MTTHKELLDLAGIGVGPFNLSLAALLDSIPECHARFFDDKSRFSWHPGLMLPGARMQTSCLKDLVTPVSPTSPWSFMNFLVTQGRFYDFMSLESLVVSRQEFTSYLSWVADNLPSLAFNTPVREISFQKDRFLIRTDNKDFIANNICMGSGKKPYIPPCARTHLSNNCFHATSLNTRRPELAGKRVAVVGGGQTGAEVFMNSLHGLWGKPADIVWISRRPNYEPLDESPFTNQFFTPDYVDAFHGIEDERKAHITQRQKLASDGITPAYLSQMYEELYYQNYVEQGRLPDWQLAPDRELVQMEKNIGGYQLELTNKFQNTRENLTVDAIILCTGFEYCLPEYLEPLLPLIPGGESGQLPLDKDFRVQWDGPGDRKIFAVNAGLHSHGIAEPQLSLNAWRSAKIINNLFQEKHFDLGGKPRLMQWSSWNHISKDGKPRNAA
ncbi:lysine N(6)-hydroxylase/L-ornithine N(5)-oxygenase family protein [Parendozoicomonas haliclonae]|uniref:L-lysine N6-monooxygenase n=1 Tax=Parendozoicomonas haliclonae TaxID=1960125 RepID=A0A1X7AP54_9GAMM|nr:SidA/IucD/PvdA family monooxygenase [Parendozoicomonas haliclonae]SMA48971.1 L-lysine N6-monooxygenase [Parendozoicomonas haliclonae]